MVVLGKENCINRKCLLPLTFQLPKITSTTAKNQQIVRIKEKYSYVYLPQNVQRENGVYTHPNYHLI
jgi:hypothetical protein